MAFSIDTDPVTEVRIETSVPSDEDHIQQRYIASLISTLWNLESFNIYILYWSFFLWDSAFPKLTSTIQQIIVALKFAL